MKTKFYVIFFTLIGSILVFIGDYLHSTGTKIVGGGSILFAMFYLAMTFIFGDE